MTAQAGPISRESYAGTISNPQEPSIPRLISDSPSLSSLFVEFRKVNAREDCKRHPLWKRLAQSKRDDYSIEGAISATSYASVIPKTTGILMGMYEIEVGPYQGSVAGSWKEFNDHAEVKEAGSQSVFHEELDLYHPLLKDDTNSCAKDERPQFPPKKMSSEQTFPPVDSDHDDDGEGEHHDWLEGHSAVKFLIAGGVAGAVSRTCTAPLDRLKIFLMTRSPDLGGTALTPKPSVHGAKAIVNALARIYAEGGVLAFWTGNGLSVAKIFPESAIKFLTYESSKRAFAKYVDKVDDLRDISGTSRFLSGGLGGITSQLSIYPMETLKTQMMSTTGNQKRTLVSAVRRVWQLGGVPAYYRGLTIGLLGVFPYSAIDMSTFEALKLAYLRSTGKDEPGVLALLAFGSISGSVGATSVYPLNLVRTRLQASGSSGHPQRYNSIMDVAIKTYERDGWRGFYRGLFPTLAKVVPAVSISYMVYEHSKRRLGV